MPVSFQKARPYSGVKCRPKVLRSPPGLTQVSCQFREELVGWNKPTRWEPSPEVTRRVVYRYELECGTKDKRMRNNCSSEDSLRFESAFESGNLSRAIKVYHTEGEQEYDLTVHPDVTAPQWRQWFFFQVRGMKKSTPYRFNILNFARYVVLTFPHPF